MKTKKNTLKIVGIVLLVLAAVFSIVSLIFVKISFDDIFRRTSLRENSAYLRYTDVEGQYDRELLSFQSGKNQLQGYLYGEGNGKGLVVISHGLGGGAESYLAETLCFVDHGYQVFGYDNTGCCGSEGKNCVGLPQSVLDLDAALTYLEGQARFAGLPVLLYGHSWGGYAVTAIFNFPHEIAASVSVAGFNRPMEMIMEWGEGMMGPLVYVEYPFISLYQRVLFGNRIDLNAVDGINSTDTPVLLIHGSGDTTVGFAGAGTIASREEITNPHVQYKICGTPPQDDHNQLFAALDAIAYAEEMDAAYDGLYGLYGGEIPAELEQAFYSGIDKRRMSALDESFMADVLAFYDAALA